MSLIEILVVLAIAGLMVQVAAIGFGPALEAKKIRATNQIVSTIRYAYNRSRVYGIYMRLEIDFEKGAFSLQEAEDAMYLPATGRDGRIRIIDESEIEEREQRDRAAAERYNESLQANLNRMGGGVMGMGGAGGAGAAGGAGMNPAQGGAGGAMNPYMPTPAEVPRAKPPIFEAFKDENSLTGLGEALELPKGVKVYAFRSDADVEEIKEGKGYLYFFPNGRTQRAHILLSEDEGETGTTIKIQPLTGKVEVVPELVPLELPEDFKGGKDDLGRTIERRSF